MIGPLNIQGTEETPSVNFDASSSTFEILGRSYPEDAHSFYEPIIKWLMEYGQNPADQTHLVVDLEYFNSGSVKKVFNILYMIEDIMETGKDVKVIWKHKVGDELMQQKGLEFQNFLQVPVEVVEY